MSNVNSKLLASNEGGYYGELDWSVSATDFSGTDIYSSSYGANLINEQWPLRLPLRRAQFDPDAYSSAAIAQYGARAGWDEADGMTDFLGISIAATEALTISESAVRVGNFVRANPTSYSRTVTIDHTQVPSTQTDLPILVSVTDAALKSVANGGHVNRSDGFDIKFCSDSAGATLLKFEVKRYNSSTGELIAWVKIPSVSSSVDTVFYLFYGDPSITTDQSDPVNVWTNSYLAAYGLKDGTTLSVADSLNSNNGTNHGATAAAGRIDGCASFVAASSQYIDCGNGMNPAQITISAWVKATSFPNAYNTVVGRSATNDYAILYVKSNGKLACYCFAGADVSYDGTGSHTLSAGTWYYLVMTYDHSASGGVIGYVNAASDGSKAAASVDLNIAVARTDIGQDANNSGRFWDGLLDTVHVASVPRSPDWITCEYNNQKPSSTFITLGAESSSGGDAPSTSESLTRVAGLGRTTTESPATSEAASRIFSGARTTNEAISTAESLARILHSLRAVTDAPATSESAAATASHNRTLSDAPTTSESATRIFSGSRTASDAPATSEATTRIFSGIRATSDAPATSESASRTASLNRTVADAINTTDAAARVLALLRAATDAISTSESTTRTISAQRSINEAPTTSESAARTLSESRTTADNPSTNESVARLLAAQRSASDTPSASESATRSLSGQRTAADNPVTSESGTHVLAALRSCADNPVLAESVIAVLSALRPTSDSISTAESALRVAISLRSTSDNPSTSESATRAAIFLRAVAENPAVTEAANRLLVLLRATTEAPSTSESADAAKTASNVSATDSLSTNESASRTLNARRSAADAPGTTELAARVLRAQRITTDALTTSESTQATTSGGVTASDALATSETVTRAVATQRSAADRLTISELVGRVAVLLRRAADAIALMEMIVWRRGRSFRIIVACSTTVDVKQSDLALRDVRIDARAEED